MDKYNFTENDFSLFEERVKAKRDNDFCSVWIIKVFGEVYVTSSGKCGWKQKSHAKSALKLDMWSLVRSLNEKYKPRCSNKNKLWNDYISALEEKGIVEFVKVC